MHRYVNDMGYQISGDMGLGLALLPFGNGEATADSARIAFNR